jgi:hypothetical protein
MNAKRLPLWFFVSFEVCLCLVILVKLVPAAVKAKSVAALVGAAAVAVPWTLVAGGAVLAWRKLAPAKAFARKQR